MPPQLDRALPAVSEGTGMFRLGGIKRGSAAARSLALASLVCGIGVSLDAWAHHPGSHAVRQSGGGVRLEAVATASDACTTIQSVTVGVPPGIRSVPGSTPVTLRLQRAPGAVCATVVSALREQAVLDVPPASTVLNLYVVAPDGNVLGSERVPITP